MSIIVAIRFTTSERARGEKPARQKEGSGSANHHRTNTIVPTLVLRSAKHPLLARASRHHAQQSHHSPHHPKRTSAPPQQQKPSIPSCSFVHLTPITLRAQSAITTLTLQKTCIRSFLTLCLSSSSRVRIQATRKWQWGQSTRIQK